MAYDAGQARQEMLDEIAVAIDAIGSALASLGEAYELLDERSADRLEAELFGPVQAAYGRAQRTYAGFAARFVLVTRPFVAGVRGAPSLGARGFVDAAVEAVGDADRKLAELQDSMRPVDVGDAELRAGLEAVRSRVVDVRRNAREFVRTLGR